MRYLPRFLLVFFRLIVLSTVLGWSAFDARAGVHVNLYNGPAPGSLGSRPEIDIPYFVAFIPPKGVPQSTQPAVIICPGGGYQAVMLSIEGVNVAKWWQSHGVAAMVLRYRLPGQGYRYPIPLQDVQRAIRLVRSRAEEWHVNPDKVGIMGFSAGGHLASTLETHFDAGNPTAADPIDRLSCRPDFAVLGYPVISMKDGITHNGSKRNLLGPNPDPALVQSLSNETQVTAQTPPTYILVAADDKVVKPVNSDLMFAALKTAGIPSFLQVYPAGGHGFGYGGNWGGPDHSPPGWLDAMGKWLQDQGLITLTTPPPVPTPAPAPSVIPTTAPSVSPTP